MNGRFARLAKELASKAAKTDLVQNFIRDLKSIRIIWAWIVMSLFVWECVWSVLYHPEAIPTVVTVTGGLAGAVVSGYILSTTYEKIKNGNGYGNGNQPPLPPAGGGNGDSD